ncbi:MAG: sensor histidine kinase [Terriglobales bacterium]
MNERQLNPAVTGVTGDSLTGSAEWNIQRDHAIVHFFAVLAGMEDVGVRTRLLVSGLGFFLRMDVVVLGFEESGSNTCRVQIWQRDTSSEFQSTPADEDSIASSVARAVEETDCPPCRMLKLVHLGKTIGFLAIARHDSSELNPEQEFLLASFETLTALLLANDRAVVEVKQQAARLHLRNRTLDAISTIFKEALKCETDEELGRACLRVAEEITGSRIGFIGEIGADGLLHDVAISEPGWAACAMYTRTGHRRPPSSFKVHGLYGRILQDGKSLLTNSPMEHPDSIGTPPGHPRLTAFLGVPLIDGGRTIGIVAVANREGGYRQEELESLSALAPAIVEALQRKRTEQALVRSQKLASVGRLAATIAHEVNNPLAAAMNAVYLVARDKFISPESRALAHSAEQELRRAAQIARRTLGFYREPNSRTNVLIAEILRDLAEVYGPRNGGKHVEIRLRCADENAAVIGNVGELRQLFSNLLANSIDAVGTQSGTVHMRVSKPVYMNCARRVRITVADTGAGIEPHHLNRLFEPFFTTKKDVGTGLGLWICEQIVRKHAGTIRVRSRVGRGTVISVTLPAAGAKAFSATAGEIAD